jgi:glutamate racemase
MDSGVGGIGVLKECIKQLPNEHFLYVADNEHSPYGNKTRKKLNKLSANLIDHYVSKYNIKLILLACNTLTASSIANLRKQFNVPFVGVEPAIKLATEKGKNNILVLSTVATFRYNKNLNKIKKQKLKIIFFLPLKNLAKQIDENLNNLNQLQKKINKLLKPYQNKNINSVVLGCTHYLFVKNQIKTALKQPNLMFYESSVYVAKRVKFLLEQNNRLSQTKKGSVTIFLTKEDHSLKQKLTDYLN